MGTVTMGAVLFEEPINSARLISAALIIAGIIGLKLTATSLEPIEPESTGLRERLMDRSEALKIVVPTASVAAFGSLVFAAAVHFNWLAKALWLSSLGRMDISSTTLAYP